jgi:hypothetical protein
MERIIKKVTCDTIDSLPTMQQIHRILEKMVALGKFEKIQSPIDRDENIVVRDRNRL